MKKTFLLIVLAFSITQAMCQQNRLEVPLYEREVPNEISATSQAVHKDRIPTLTVFLPPKGKANQTAVVVFPGGGYSHLAIDHEGYAVAKKLNEQGIAAFVVKYRLPSAKFSEKPEISPLQDAQQAIRMVRTRAKEWNLNPEKVGIIGFSAGGHLASTAGTHFRNTVISNPEKTSLRPDFMILIYPVINGGPEVAHQGSFDNLLGKNASAEKTKAYSNDQQVTDQTPPSFLVHASDDKAVKPENSILFYQALVRHNVPVEMHIYEKGGHGFGLNNKTTQDSWFDRCMNWMKSSNLVPSE